MRLFFIMLVLALVLGCAANNRSEAGNKFDISLLNTSHSEEFVVEKNKTIDSISFILLNNERFALDCSFTLILNNISNTSSYDSEVGIIPPHGTKKVNVSFEMFFGNTSLSIVPDCQKAS